MGVEDARRHCADPVEENLQREDPEQEYRERCSLPRLLPREVPRGPPRGQQVYERSGEDEDQHGYDGEERHDQGEERVREPAGVFLPGTGEALDEERDEDGG